MRQALTSSQQRYTHQEVPPWSVSSQCNLFQSMSDKQQLAREFCDATSIIHTYNRKGNHQSSDNRGISHLSIADKILAWVLHNRLLTHLPMWLPCWLRKHRHDLCCLQIQEREICWTAPWPLQNIFDRTKAFHTISWKWFWCLKTTIDLKPSRWLTVSSKVMC